MNKNTSLELATFARQVQEKHAAASAAEGQAAEQIHLELSQFIGQQAQALMAKGVPVTKIQETLQAIAPLTPDVTPTPFPVRAIDGRAKPPAEPRITTASPAIDQPTTPTNDKPTKRTMFSFLKELIASAKEGVAEAKAEVAAEKAAKTQQERQHREAAQARIAAIPEPEKFALALAAPFRAVLLAVWSPILEPDETDGAITYPLALYTCGEKDTLTPDQRKTLPELLERDFDIVDNPSALRAIASILQAASLTDKLKEHAAAESIEASEIINDLHQTTRLTHEEQANAKRALRSTRAFAACMAAHAISASADCGYMEKAQANELLTAVAELAKKEYTSWEDYGAEFLRGERGLNNALGRRMLVKYTAYLHKKPASPWRTISWPKN